jgi:hypothetical protein
MNAALKICDSFGQNEPEGLVRKPSPKGGLLLRALVAESGEGSLWVLVGGEEGELIEASLAPSCLLVPRLGDEVLCFIDLDKAFVLSVLERAAPEEKAELSLPGRCAVSAGELEFKAQKFNLEADEIQTAARAHRLKAESLCAEASVGGLNFSVLRLSAGLVLSWFRSFLNRSKSLRLEVSDNCAVKAGSIDLLAQEDLTVRSAGVDLKAEDSVKIDGRAIRLG